MRWLLCGTGDSFPDAARILRTAGGSPVPRFSFSDDMWGQEVAGSVIRNGTVSSPPVGLVCPGWLWEGRTTGPPGDQWSDTDSFLWAQKSPGGALRQATGGQAPGESPFLSSTEGNKASAGE